LSVRRGGCSVIPEQPSDDFILGLSDGFKLLSSQKISKLLLQSSFRAATDFWVLSRQIAEILIADALERVGVGVGGAEGWHKTGMARLRFTNQDKYPAEKP
jgi:hypothetical protein